MVMDVLVSKISPYFCLIGLVDIVLHKFFDQVTKNLCITDTLKKSVRYNVISSPVVYTLDM